MDGGRLRRMPVEHVAHLLLAALSEAALLIGRSEDPEADVRRDRRAAFDALLDGLELTTA